MASKTENPQTSAMGGWTFVLAKSRKPLGQCQGRRDLPQLVALFFQLAWGSFRGDDTPCLAGMVPFPLLDTAILPKIPELSLSLIMIDA
ncbi:hypothetical protein HYQ46_011955 [Verticillium longisporum]|nr:hypothetical protein HYQ46_011955 [Verticillium longisporum]